MNLCDSSLNLVHERMDQKFSQVDKQLIIRILHCQIIKIQIKHLEMGLGFGTSHYKASLHKSRRCYKFLWKLQV